jgi:hypothetical protein
MSTGIKLHSGAGHVSAIISAVMVIVSFSLFVVGEQYHAGRFYVKSAR